MSSKVIKWFIRQASIRKNSKSTNNNSDEKEASNSKKNPEQKRRISFAKLSFRRRKNKSLDSVPVESPHPSNMGAPDSQSDGGAVCDTSSSLSFKDSPGQSPVRELSLSSSAANSPEHSSTAGSPTQYLLNSSTDDGQCSETVESDFKIRINQDKSPTNDIAIVHPVTFSTTIKETSSSTQNSPMFTIHQDSQNIPYEQQSSRANVDEVTNPGAQVSQATKGGANVPLQFSTPKHENTVTFDEVLRLYEIEESRHTKHEATCHSKQNGRQDDDVTWAPSKEEDDFIAPHSDGIVNYPNGDTADEDEIEFIDSDVTSQSDSVGNDFSDSSMKGSEVETAVVSQERSNPSTTEHVTETSSQTSSLDDHTNLNNMEDTPVKGCEDDPPKTDVKIVITEPSPEHKPFSISPPVQTSPPLTPVHDDSAFLVQKSKISNQSYQVVPIQRTFIVKRVDQTRPNMFIHENSTTSCIQTEPPSNQQQTNSTNIDSVSESHSDTVTPIVGDRKDTTIVDSDATTNSILMDLTSRKDSLSSDVKKVGHPSSTDLESPDPKDDSRLLQEDPKISKHEDSLSSPTNSPNSLTNSPRSPTNSPRSPINSPSSPINSPSSPTNSPCSPTIVDPSSPTPSNSFTSPKFKREFPSLALSPDYPDELNPFGDEDDEVLEVTVDEFRARVAGGESLNPFGSDSEGEGEMEGDGRGGSEHRSFNGIDFKHSNGNFVARNEECPKPLPRSSLKSDEDDLPERFSPTNPFADDETDDSALPAETPPTLPPKTERRPSGPVPRPRKTKQGLHGSFTSLQSIPIYPVPVPAPRTMTPTSSARNLNDPSGEIDDRSTFFNRDSCERASLNALPSSLSHESLSRGGVRGSVPANTRVRLPRKKRLAPLPPQKLPTEEVTADPPPSSSHSSGVFFSLPRALRRTPSPFNKNPDAASLSTRPPPRPPPPSYTPTRK